MFYLLSLISNYHMEVSGENYDSYFTKFPRYQYSFKKSANYSFDFRIINQDYFIFGLANNKEIQQIEKIKNSDIYCSGCYQISQIQFYVSYYMNSFSGQVESGGLLTPYIFSCNSQYSLNLDLNYQNGSNNLDSRIQIFHIYSIIYAILSSAILIGLFCYTTYYGYKRKLLLCQENYCFCQCDSFYFIKNFGFILLSYVLQDYGMTSFFGDQKDKEYFELIDENSINNNFKNIFKSILYYMFVLICICIFSFYCYKQNLGCQSKILFFAYQFVAIIMVMVFLISPYDIIMEIVYFIMFFIYALINMIYMRSFSIIRFGMFLYYIGSLVAFNIGHILVFKASDKCSIHMLALILASILMIFQCASMILYLLAIFYFHEFDDDKLIVILNIHVPIQAQVPIYHREDSYTFIIHEEISVVVDQNDKKKNNETEFESTISDSSIVSNIKGNNSIV